MAPLFVAFCDNVAAGYCALKSVNRNSITLCTVRVSVLLFFLSLLLLSPSVGSMTISVGVIVTAYNCYLVLWSFELRASPGRRLGCRFYGCNCCRSSPASLCASSSVSLPSPPSPPCCPYPCHVLAVLMPLARKLLSVFNCFPFKHRRSRRRRRCQN